MVLEALYGHVYCLLLENTSVCEELKILAKPENMPSSWKEIVSPLFGAFLKNDVLIRTALIMKTFKQRSRVTTDRYPEALWTVILRRNQVRTEYNLKGIFMDGLPYSIPNSMRPYRSSNRTVNLHELELHAVSLRTLQRETAHSETSRVRRKQIVVETENNSNTGYVLITWPAPKV